MGILTNCALYAFSGGEAVENPQPQRFGETLDGQFYLTTALDTTTMFFVAGLVKGLAFRKIIGYYSYLRICRSYCKRLSILAKW